MNTKTDSQILNNWPLLDSPNCFRQNQGITALNGNGQDVVQQMHQTKYILSGFIDSQRTISSQNYISGSKTFQPLSVLSSWLILLQTYIYLHYSIFLAECHLYEVYLFDCIGLHVSTTVIADLVCALFDSYLYRVLSFNTLLCNSSLIESWLKYKIPMAVEIILFLLSSSAQELQFLFI